MATTPMRNSPTRQMARRPQLSEEIADLVGNQIMAGELRPGMFIRLDETATNLGVSVTPVREALLTLKGEGLVDLVPRRGYSVSPLSRRDIEDIFWIQLTLARRLIGRAFEHFDDTDKAELVRLVDDFDAAAASGNNETVVQAQHRIYRMINIAATSDKLVRILATVSRYIPVHLYAADPEWCSVQSARNRDLADAAMSGDSEKGLRSFEAQYTDACARLIEHLESAGVWDEES